MDLILYHGKCTDGWAAAYVAHLRYPEAQLLGVNYGEPPPIVKDLDVLVVDFSWKREITEGLVAAAKSFHILDHHKTAQAELEGLNYTTFDMKRSGVGLAWDYLFGRDNKDRPFQVPGKLGVVGYLFKARPWWVDYVEDYDLWTKKLPMIDAISAFLHALPKTTEVWDGLHNGDISFEKAVSIGSGMLEHQRYQVSALLEIANSVGAWGLRVGIVNAPYFMSSDLGKALADTHDVGMTWYQRKDGKFVFSLRSNDKGDIDVSKIAIRMGGGGHKHSAGFEMNQSAGLSWLNALKLEEGGRCPS